MSVKRRKVCSLENLSFKRVCRDVVRHSLKFEAESDKESSVYLNFQHLFSNQLLPVLYSVSNESCFNRNTTSAFNSCINFVFNPMLEDIHISTSVEFTEEIAAAISTNCKKSRLLVLVQQSLSSDTSLILFKSMKNLAALNLHGCSFEGVKLMKVIADSLVNLVTLVLTETNIDDDALYVLCGHHWPSCEAEVSKCKFLKTCDVNCALKLKDIDLYDTTNVTIVGVACLLTHVPTLRFLKTRKIPLSRVISKICKQLEERQMPMLQLELKRISPMLHPVEMRRCLEACPKLEELFVFLEDGHPEADEFLADAELPHLKIVNMMSTSLGRTFNERLKCFWQKWGPQLTYISLDDTLFEDHTECDLNAIRNLLISSPKLQIFVLRHFVSSEEDSFHPFPEHPCVGRITLHLSGNDDDAVNAFAYKFIRSFPNIVRWGLFFKIKKEILIRCFEFLPHLQTLVLMKHAVNKDFVSFLRNKGYKVQIA